MLVSRLISTLCWAASFSFAVAKPAPLPEVLNPAPVVALRTRNLPGTSDRDTIHGIYRRLDQAVRLAGRDIDLKNSTSIDKSWNGAVLIDTGSDSDVGVKVVCTTCYVKGKAIAQLTVVGSFDASSIVANVTSQVGDDIDKVINATVHNVETYAEDFIKNFNLSKPDFTFQNYPLDVDFNIDMPPFPATQLMFQFDGMELYMLLNLTLTKATYTLPLYKSETPIGLSIGQDLEIGVVMTVDLVLTAETEIIIQSGFHIKLDDGVALKIALFGQNVSDIVFNGGAFEFFPVTIEIVGGATLRANLRLGVHAGFSVESPNLDIPDVSFGAGVEVGVFAHLAEFATNITSLNTPDASGCRVRVEEEYTLAIGAAAGATAFFNDHTWGPVVATTIPVFYTTMPAVCAASTTQANAAHTVTPEINGRQEGALTTAILKTSAVFTGVACAQLGLVNCPASLQQTTIKTSAIILVTAVPSGVEATFPATTATTPVVAIPFGTDAKSLASLSGSPTSFIPSLATNGVFGGNVTALLDSSTGGVSNKVIIGVSVGVGVPVVIALIAGLVYGSPFHLVSVSPLPPSPLVELEAKQFTDILGGGKQVLHQAQETRGLRAGRSVDLDHRQLQPRRTVCSEALGFTEEATRGNCAALSQHLWELGFCRRLFWFYSAIDLGKIDFEGTVRIRWAGLGMAWNGREKGCLGLGFLFWIACYECFFLSSCITNSSSLKRFFP
ncbi:hypothetical protein B0T19DRAFT_270367 [Cercophora scortea]|uniref:Uncharacterized protein n=1 Tax=Cercophora scortea TaxID=314031 RepID=A0AAE0I743_9PEZI|nr:hypothetical protein B0T19DRAFT_270367 [Cercophora scortea]